MDDVAKGPPKSGSAFLLGLLTVVLIGWLAMENLFVSKAQIGGTALVIEVSSGISFNARVDTGAAVSSIHYEEMTIENESVEPRENRGKQIRLLIANETGQQAWVETEIVDYSNVKSVDATTGRYYVRLQLTCMGIEKETLVTLNDRARMSHKLLLGRDFLAGDFVVDVSK